MQTVHISALDLNLAVVLDALLKERSVSRAAKRIGLSQSATSHALARLRGVLGDPLLVRTRHGVAPTARAEQMAAPLAEALAGLERTLLAAPRFEPATARRTFRIAATDYAELLVVPRLLAAIAKQAPGVDIWMRPMGDDALAALRRGELDLVLGVFSPSVLAGGLQARPLLDDRLVSIVRKGHPLTRGKLTLARFVAADHALIAPRGNPGGPVDDALAARGLRRRIGFTTPHFVVAPHAIAGTDLVLTLAERVATLFADQLPLRVLEPPLRLPKIRLAMIWQQGYDTDPAHRWLRERLEAVASALG
jgi:DNA-binding transcriptional LysR family regulator